MMLRCNLNILYEDDRLLAVRKPAGLVCHPTKPDGHSSLISQLRQFMGPGSTPSMINRLDRETTGVVLVAKQAGTARVLYRAWEQGRVRKEYLAIVHGRVPVDRGVIDAPLGRDEQSRVAVKDRVRPDGHPASTRFAVARRLTRSGREFSLLRLWPITGRKHQIRIHLAHFGFPVVGDKLYGGDESCYLAYTRNRLTEQHQAALILPFHALVARSVQIEWAGRMQQFVAEPEVWFASFLGESAAFGRHDVRSEPAGQCR